MQSEPSFSIVTVTLNSARHLQTAIESVRSQTYRSFEHIIVDGGSTDETLQIVDKFGDHIATRISEPDAGIYDAFNKGVRLARNEIIAFLNSDDYYCDNTTLQSVAEVFREDPACVAVYGKERQEAHSRPGRPGQVFGRKIELPEFAQGYMPPHSAFFVRASAFARIGLFDLNYRVASDFDWVVRLFLAEGDGFRFLDKTLTCFRTGGVSTAYLTRSLGLRERQELLLRHFGIRRNLATEELQNNARFRVWLERLLLHNEGITRSLHESGIRTVAIFGTLTVAEYLVRDCLNSGLSVPALVDNNQELHGQALSGIPVVPEAWLRQGRPDVLLVSIESDSDRPLIERLKADYGSFLRIVSWKELAR
jgi:glycosyltransferase involved in cell wall biosynthesis